MRAYALMLLLPCFVGMSAQDSLVHEVDTVQLSVHSISLDSLIHSRRQAERLVAGHTHSVRLNPYFYRMLAPGTLYNDALGNSLQPRWQFGRPANVAPQLGSTVGVYDMLSASDRSLVNIYVQHPELITYTDNEIQSQTKLREEVKQPIEAQTNLGQMAVPSDLGNDMAEPVAVKALKPKFWKVKGNGTLNVTQNAYSDNWFQGGENNYSGLARVTLEANYDNRQKLKWNNKLEAEVSLQTSSDTVHNPRITNNRLRLTSGVGYKAAKNWDYSTEVQATTQMFRNFNTNSYTYSSGFLAPLYLNISIGMTYTYKSKKGRFWGSLKLAPVSYDMRYVASDSIPLRSRHGIKEGHKSLHNFGPNVKWEFDWQVCKNVSWHSYMYFFTNFDYTQLQWENNIRFKINKYLSSEFYFYPRFDDSSSRYRGDKGYWMYKEWLSLGVSYDF